MRWALSLVVCSCAALLTPALPSAALAAKPKVAASDAAEITFLGYQSLPDGRGLLFVDLSRSVEVEVKRNGAVVEYELLSARVPLRNNKNPLLLRDFASSALTAVLVPGARGKHAKAATKSSAAPSVRLVVTLRGNVQPNHRVVSHGKGARLEIELPAPAAS